MHGKVVAPLASIQALDELMESVEADVERPRAAIETMHSLWRGSGSMKERDVQRAILDYLAARGILAFRMQTGASVSEYKGKRRLVRFGVPGMADILAFPIHGTCKSIPVRGGFYDVTLTEQWPTWIECKAPKGKQSELQASFQRQVEEHGHKYIIARAVEDVERVFG